MKNKGFTLIELLAVIIILSVLAFLITPKVVNMLNESEINTNKASAEGIIKAVIYKYQDNEMLGLPNNNVIINYGNNVNIDYLDYNGTKPETGVVSIRKNGKVAMAVKFKDYCYLKEYNKAEITTVPYDAETCGENASIFINYEMPEIVQSGDGLYESIELERYVYRGSNPDNYIWLDENDDKEKQTTEMYRIISFESDGTIKVIRNESIGNIAWDSNASSENRKNENNTYCNYTGTYYGCNVWGSTDTTRSNGSSLPDIFNYKYYQNSASTSLINSGNSGTVTQYSSLNTYLNNYWVSTTSLDNYIEDHEFNVGGVYYTSSYTGGDKGLQKEESEEKLYTWNGKIGLMNITDYVETSLNPTCTSVYSNFYYNTNYYYESSQHITEYDNWPCSNRTYNWLPKAITEWSLSPHPSNRNYVWSVRSAGYFNTNSAYNAFGVRPAFYLKQSLTLTGNGTIEDPFRIVNEA